MYSDHERWDDMPCMDCDKRDGNFCKFYKVELEECAPGVYMPCGKCEDDCSEKE